MTRSAVGATLLAVVGAYLLVVFVLCPRNSVVGFPVHHDDFANLSVRAGDGIAGSFSFSSLAPRPVSYYALATLSAAGIPIYYVALHLLVIAYVVFVLRTLQCFFGIQRMPLLAMAVVAAAMLSYEHTVEYSKYTGLITNLLSATFAAAAIHLMMTARERFDNPGHALLPVRTIAAVWILSGLSFWSKEDFIVPVVLVAAYMTWEVRLRAESRDRRWLILVSGVLLLAGAWSLYDRSVSSPFTHAAAGPYEADFALRSIARTAGKYFLMTPVSSLGVALQASIVIWNAIAGAPIRWARMLLFQVLVVSLVLPYACLPNHVSPYYGLNWFVWQAGGALLVLWTLDRSGVVVRWGGVVLAVLLVSVGQPVRRDIAAWYQTEGRINREILRLLVEHRSTLAPYRRVAVEGAPMLGPWFAGDGRFLQQRYGLDHEWLVRVPADSEYRRRLLALSGSLVNGSVRTVALEEAPVPPGTPVIRLRPDGSGAVELP